MTLLVMLTYGCNLGCLYCFQKPAYERPINSPIRLDINKVKESILKVVSRTGHRELVLHGGEPLMVPFNVIIDFLEWARVNGFRVSVQTNGILITEEHIRVFKEYDVSVGISVDGFPELNILRGYYWKGKDINPKASEWYRKRVMKVIERLADEKTVSGRPLLGGVIVLLHKANAGNTDKLDKLIEFIKWLSDLGIKGGRLNPMYANSTYAQEYELSNEELYNAFIYVWNKIKYWDVDWSPYRDIVKILLGDRSNTVCWFGGCNYYDSFVWTVLPDGTIASCDRALASGFWTRAYEFGNSQLRNMQIRFKGNLPVSKYKYPHVHMFGCPAEAPYDPNLGVPDWRLPSRFLDAFEKLIEYFTREIKALMPWVKPLSEYPDPEKAVELELKGCRYDYIRGDYVCD